MVKNMHSMVLKKLYQRLQMNQTRTIGLKRSLDFKVNDINFFKSHKSVIEINAHRQHT